MWQSLPQFCWFGLKRHQKSGERVSELVQSCVTAVIPLRESLIDCGQGHVLVPAIVYAWPTPRLARYRFTSRAPTISAKKNKIRSGRWRIQKAVAGTNRHRHLSGGQIPFPNLSRSLGNSSFEHLHKQKNQLLKFLPRESVVATNDGHVGQRLIEVKIHVAIHVR